MRNFLAAHGFANEYQLKSHVIPVGGIERRIASNRVLLCGDSAGFADPFYGEGIAYAIRSGQLAVEAITDYLGGNAQTIQTIPQEYKKRCERAFGYNLKNSFRLTKLVHRLPQIFFPVFTNNEEVLDKYLAIPALEMSYKEYIKWLIPRVLRYLLQN
jgi:flavin-dependent dehydrogenase